MSTDADLPREDPEHVDPVVRGLPAGDPPPTPIYRTTPGSPPAFERYVGDTVPDGPLGPREERMYAALAHLSHVAGIVVAPMLLLAAIGRRSMFVDRHAREAFNHQVTVVIAFVVAGIIALRGAGPTILAVVVAYGVGFAAIAALRSWQGAIWRYPLALRLLH
jgi:uncharacterized Tic20 family protein